jgi:hypothetical protein
MPVVSCSWQRFHNRAVGSDLMKESGFFAFLADASCAVVAALIAIPVLFAGNIYPTNLAQSTSMVDYSNAETVTLGYLLNDNATGVSIEVLDSSNAVVRTINAGAQAKGSHTVVWDATDDSSNTVPVGDYSFRVNTTGSASGAWTRYDTDGTLNNFELPRGVAVNNNPNSPFYGRIYVSNGRSTNTGAGRVMGDGVFMLNADVSQTGIPGGTGPHTAGVAWQTATSVPADTGGTSPFRLQVGPDDSVYITDWSDSHSGLWQANPNLTSAVEVLDNTGRAASGLNATHGSVADVIVTGTGASRTIYTFDEDFVPPGGSTGSVPRYDIGLATTHSGAPSGYRYLDGAGTLATGNRVQNFQGSIAFDNGGNLWLSQIRAGSGTDLLASLMQFDAAGALLWSSVPNLAANSLADPLRNTQGIAYDPINNLLALITGQAGGVIQIFDPVAKTVLATFNFGSTTGTDIAFDNAGNLYATNRSAERLRLWGPPNGNVGGRNYVANAFSTNSVGPLGTIRVIPEPASCLLSVFGIGAGLSLTRRCRT